MSSAGVVLCRLCAGRSDNISIFDNPSYLPYKINFTLNIEVKRTDQRTTLCNLCLNKVNDFNDFKNMCKNTEEQGIGSNCPPIKIKEEPGFPKIQLLPNSEPVPMLPLPFLFQPVKMEKMDDTDKTKEEEKSYLNCNNVNDDGNDLNENVNVNIGQVEDKVTDEESVDSIINSVQTDDEAPTEPPRRKRKSSSVSSRRSKRVCGTPPRSTLRQTRSTTGVLPKKVIYDEDGSDPDDPFAEDGDSDEVIKPESANIKLQTPSEPPECTCVKCEKQFASTMALETHQMEDHSSETWYCYDCLCGFPNFKTWKYHKRNFCKKTAVVDCESKSGKDDSKNTHPSSAKAMFKCSFCKVEVDNNAEFLEHLKIHKKKSVSLLKCNLCDKAFQEKGALICHKEFHHKIKLSNTTPNDKKSAAENPQTAKKDETRKYNREYKCNTCEETFSNSGKLICHQVLAHKNK